MSPGSDVSAISSEFTPLPIPFRPNCDLTMTTTTQQRDHPARRAVRYDHARGRTSPSTRNSFWRRAPARFDAVCVRRLPDPSACRRQFILLCLWLTHASRAASHARDAETVRGPTGRGPPKLTIPFRLVPVRFRPRTFSGLFF